MATAGAGQDHSGSSETSLFLLLAAVVVAIFAFHSFEPQLREYLAVFLYWQTRALSSLTSVPVVGGLVAGLTGYTPSQIDSLAGYLNGGQPKNPEVLHQAAQLLGRYVSFLVLPPVALFGWVWWQNEHRYTFRIRNSRHMHQRVSEVYPELRGMDLTGKPMYEGITRCPDSVHYYADKRGLLDEEGRLKRDRASEVFAKQLGRKFTGYKDLYRQPYGWVARHIVSAIPRKYRKQALIDAKEHHRYDSTVILRLLEIARRMGIVPSSSFRKLRLQNRPLWSAISSAGRRVSFVEGLGIISQFQYEMAVREKGGKAKAAPYMKQAIIDYEAALEEVPKDEPWKLDEQIFANYDPTR